MRLGQLCFLFCSLAAAGVFLAPGVYAASAKWKDISCADSRVYATPVLGYGECRYKRATGKGSSQGDFRYYAVIVDNNSVYANVTFAIAGFRSYIFLRTPENFKERALAYHSWLAGKQALRLVTLQTPG